MSMSEAQGREIIELLRVGGGEIAAAVQNDDDVVSAVYTATIGGSSIIPTAFTATLGEATTRIVLIPRGAVYYKVGGAASAATALVPLGGLNMPVTKALADTIRIFADTIVCDMLVLEPRN